MPYTESYCTILLTKYFKMGNLIPEPVIFRPEIEICFDYGVTGIYFILAKSIMKSLYIDNGAWTTWTASELNECKLENDKNFFGKSLKTGLEVRLTLFRDLVLIKVETRLIKLRWEITFFTLWFCTSRTRSGTAEAQCVKLTYVPENHNSRYS